MGGTVSHKDTDTILLPAESTADRSIRRLPVGVRLMRFEPDKYVLQLCNRFG